MKKIILSKERVFEIVSANRYQVDKKTRFLSRCIDGRYKNNLRSSDLPALAFPGADVGELALIFATGNTYGFKVDGEKALEVLAKVVGGLENFGLHTDYHGDKKIAVSGCGHWKQINLDPTAYKLETAQVKDIQKLIDQVKKNGANEVILEGEHLEGAVLIVRGSWGILPRYKLQFEGGANEVQTFVYHQSLVDERHRVLASTLLRQKAVKLDEGCDEEYLYQVLSEIAENHLMETARRLAKGLPIYEVKFDEDGGFTLSEVKGVEIKNVGNV